MLRKLKTKDKINFECFIHHHNISKKLFPKFVRQEKLAFISEEANIINGLIYIDKEDKNYLNVFGNSKKIINNLLKILFWNWKKKIYAEVDEKDKTGFILKSNGFRIIDKKNTTFMLYYDPKEMRRTWK